MCFYETVSRDIAFALLITYSWENPGAINKVCHVLFIL